MKQFENVTKLIGSLVLAVLLVVCFSVSGYSGQMKGHEAVYTKWETLGVLAGKAGLQILKNGNSIPDTDQLIVMTNAGYAEIWGASTMPALDGIAKVTSATRGKNTLVEVQSAPWSELWFAIFDQKTGNCAYLEVNTSVAGEKNEIAGISFERLFRKQHMERIDADYLYAHAEAFSEKAKEKCFGGNEFRIITMANAISKGAPSYAVRAFEFHDHYCPGVTSGIMLAQYLKKKFPPIKGGYFIHSVDSWCKEDALLVMLNATPGKRSYAAIYPSEKDKATRKDIAKNACTIAYRKKDGKDQWEGVVLGFEWNRDVCPKTGNAIIDKLCMDLWYLERMGNTGDFVKVIKRFDLPEGVSPKDWAGPNADPLQKLGLRAGK